MKRTEMIKDYAGIVTAILTFVVYMTIMWHFTQKDILECLIVYFVFLFPVAFVVPWLIAGEDDDEDSDRTGA